MINDSFEYESQIKFYLSKYFKALINGEKMQKGYCYEKKFTSNEIKVVLKYMKKAQHKLYYWKCILKL